MSANRIGCGCNYCAKSLAVKDAIRALVEAARVSPKRAENPTLAAMKGDELEAHIRLQAYCTVMEWIGGEIAKAPMEWAESLTLGVQDAFIEGIHEEYESMGMAVFNGPSGLVVELPIKEKAN